MGTWKGSSTRDFERWLKGALELERLSLWELCEANLKGRSLAGDPEGFVERFCRRASVCIEVPLGNLEGGSPVGNLERWMIGALRMERLTLKRLIGEGFEGGTFTLDPGRYVKAPDTGISHHRGPFKAEGNLESGRGS